MSQFLELGHAVFEPLVVVFTIANLAGMGLQVLLPELLERARNPRFLALVLAWGWIVGPALGWLITTLLPMAEPFAAVVWITSLAPCAPFLPPVVERARGDLEFAGAFIPMAAVGTVVFMPLLAPLLIEGLTLSPAALARPLVATMLVPLLVGAWLRTYSPAVARRIARPVKLVAAVSTAMTVTLCIVLYAGRMLETAGSFALVAMTLFMAVLGSVAYRFGFGLGQSERVVMSLGMGTRNIAAVFAGVLAIPDRDPRMVAMIAMWTLWSFALAHAFAPLYRRQAGGAAAH